MTRGGTTADGQNPNFPTGATPNWFRDDQHSQLDQARGAIGEPATDRVIIAHFDTGYDPGHSTLPRHLRIDLQRNFVDEDFPNDATDRSAGTMNNLGHGTGTLSILAGNDVAGVPLGGAYALDVIPIRVANSVVLFKNSAIARAFDYVHGLAAVQVDVITMSMGGLASQAWADAVNALYESGVFIVTAAGNNFGNLPTHNIVYPARFKRVVAACGVMANGAPYADLPLDEMAGNYGPPSKMPTAIAGCTPNVPWARFGSTNIVDLDGQGTSAATPQIAAAAALWIQRNRSTLAGYSKPWMRVEAVRKALFDSAMLASPGLGERLGRGMVHAAQALSVAPAAEADLRERPADDASFEFLRILTGLGAAPPDARHRMLELEALQLTQQSHELEMLMPDADVPPAAVSAADRQRFIDALIAAPGASANLRAELQRKSSAASPPQVAVPAHLSQLEQRRLAGAIDPPMHPPATRNLRVFAFDPLLGAQPDTVGLNETTLDVVWEEDLAPGPVGEYVEVVDVDPATGVCYAPVDLNRPLPLAHDGLSPSESNPQFHQQMVYAVAMKTIEHFERALGRRALWAPRQVRQNGKYSEYYVGRLRIYPHAMREANSYYSPDKKALLLGYFPASSTDAGRNLPGGTIFCSLSHDIVAHETTHALLDGLHSRFREPTNPDVLAFHEAFADIVALFQHFTIPEALRDQIGRTQGNLARQNILGELAQQFGEGTEKHGALRSAIGTVVVDEKTGEQRWVPTKPEANLYRSTTEPHELGAVLVAAVFNAFLDIYQIRSADLIRLATQGTGVLPPGSISRDLTDRLAQEASKTAGHVLQICIRALDYCPPVDIKFGEYLRALITADRDMVPDDELSYRAAFIEAFRARGIYPDGVRSLSVESLCWERPEIDPAVNAKLAAILKEMSYDWDLSAKRRDAFEVSKQNAKLFHQWVEDNLTDEDAEALGFYRAGRVAAIENQFHGELRRFEVHSVRPVRRVGRDDNPRLDVVIEITQSWIPADSGGQKYRGGCTLIIDQRNHYIKYCVRKRVANQQRVQAQQAFQLEMQGSYIRSNYFENVSSGREPFAMLHRAT
ncbi:MAG TPA: S8 family serine peptidase [Candidatus Acidoferrales bacterium]|nr:S8 family serine peptidase [Candidatus Acidoferrales bacterium]